MTLGPLIIYFLIITGCLSYSIGRLICVLFFEDIFQDEKFMTFLIGLGAILSLITFILIGYVIHGIWNMPVFK